MIDLNNFFVGFRIGLIACGLIILFAIFCVIKNKIKAKRDKDGRG